MPTPALTMLGFSRSSRSLLGNSGIGFRQGTVGLEEYLTSHGTDLYEKNGVFVGQLNKRHRVFKLTLYEIGAPFKVKTQRSITQSSYEQIYLAGVSDIEQLGVGVLDTPGIDWPNGPLRFLGNSGGRHEQQVTEGGYRWFGRGVSIRCHQLNFELARS
jgi:hypothetical protein